MNIDSHKKRDESVPRPAFGLLKSALEIAEVIYVGDFLYRAVGVVLSYALCGRPIESSSLIVVTYIVPFLCYVAIKRMLAIMDDFVTD